jgi:hypothetical protein
LSVGAQPSDAVRRLLEKQGTYGRLGRLHRGESFDTLVAEFQGTALPQAEMAPSQPVPVTGDILVDVSPDVAAAVEEMDDVEAAAAVAAVTEMTGAMAVDETGETTEEE